MVSPEARTRPDKCCDMHTALEIAVRLAETFPGDPCRATLPFTGATSKRSCNIFGFCLGPPFW